MAAPGAVRKLVLVERLRLHLDAEAGRFGYRVTSLAQDDRMHEMLVQMIGKFRHPALQAPAHADIVDKRQMLRVLAQADSAGVRTHGNIEFRREQHDCQRFAESTEPATIQLAEVDGARLQKLLEDYAIGAMLSGCDADWMNGAAYGRVPENIVGAGRFFDPERIESGQRAHEIDRLDDVTSMISIHHHQATGSDFLAHQRGAAHVFVGVPADLDLETGPSGRPRLAAQFPHEFIRIAHPSG